MTPADRSRVLLACGFEEHRYDAPAENYWTMGGVCRGRNPEPTQQEAWKTLCRLCREQSFSGEFPNFGEPVPIRAVLDGLDDKVSLFTGRKMILIVYFTVREHGSLNAAIEEAILWVLDQKEGGK
jgi:hypothetical protein